MRMFLLAACAAFSFSTVAKAADCHFYSFSENTADHTGDAQVDKRCNPRGLEFNAELQRFNRMHPGFIITIDPAAYDKHNIAGYYPLHMKRRRLVDNNEPTHQCIGGISYKIYRSGKQVLERTAQGVTIVCGR